MEKYDKKLNLGKDGKENLTSKQEIIILTKADIIPLQGLPLLKFIDKEKKKFEKISKDVFVLSLFDDKMVKKFRDELVKILKKKLCFFFGYKNCVDYAGAAWSTGNFR